jgi:hypothetical protein
LFEFNAYDLSYFCREPAELYNLTIMCWNQDISLNTFIFSCFALVFIYITNTYSRYKTPVFDNPLMYAFALSVSSMQLLEYFIWKHIKNKSMNIFLSKLGPLILFLQVFFLILLMEKYYEWMMAIFLVSCLGFYLYSLQHPVLFRSRESEGHLSWDWIILPGLSNWTNFFLLILGLSFYMIPALYLKGITYPYRLVIFSLFLYVFVYFIGKKGHTYGSLWCWAVNGFFLYFLINILLILPFYEYNGLC